MPIGNLDVPVIGKNVVIAALVQSHILFATFIIGAVLIAATSEYLGMVTKQPRYERFARNLARFVVLLFASGAALALYFLGVWARAYRWSILLRPIKHVRTRELLPITAIGFMANNVLPLR